MNRAVNHYLCPPAMAMLDFLDAAASANFQSVGLTIGSLDEMPIKKLQQELMARDLQISSINTAGYFFPTATAAVDQEAINLRLLQVAAELQPANGVNLIVGGSTELDLASARESAMAKSALLAATAKQYGTRLLLEPMHPLNVRSKGCVNTLRQAAQWLTQIPELALNVDLFHSWWDPDLEDALSGTLGEIGVLQICDIVIDPKTNLPLRGPLDEGFLDWRVAVKRFAKQFPDTPVELELFAAQMPDRDSLGVMSAGGRLMKAVF